MGEALNHPGDDLVRCSKEGCRVYHYTHSQPPVHSGEDPRIIAGLLADDPLTNAATGKPCKGKEAARSLAVLVLTEETYLYLQRCDPKALEQAKKALEPFGYPDLEALQKKLNY